MSPLRSWRFRWNINYPKVFFKWNKILLLCLQIRRNRVTLMRSHEFICEVFWHEMNFIRNRKPNGLIKKPENSDWNIWILDRIWKQRFIERYFDGGIVVKQNCGHEFSGSEALLCIETDFLSILSLKYLLPEFVGSVLLQIPIRIQVKWTMWIIWIAALLLPISILYQWTPNSSTPIQTRHGIHCQLTDSDVWRPLTHLLHLAACTHAHQ